ncbi:MULTISPECIES: methionine ABC transporter permease [Sanguibacter]|jgi:D-methionine transport system permease protein|uniref:ABC transporter permease n=2 Tax=Sanguibacter TaxID=60919 RepID=A0A853EUZ4_9MICO|nr:MULTISPECIES: methionine ABC transporter permease [Sanguibacter]KQT96617.1 methionine ABC transporter ATP-binding protein [Sanguibacter sp. Leaf3]MBF0723224.1 ABC transporter permease [Sanguibacter inulinus]NYS94369.1 ABC transporter permease [Sanguibacter inulinus]WPF82819.1 ABC transporter permease [Sanguibacter sp. 4.1]
MTDWSVLGPRLWSALGETLQMVSATMLLGGLVGLLIGLGLYTTRKGNLLSNPVVFNVLNVIVNFVRPIPFIIFVTAIRPVTYEVTGATIGVQAVILPMTLMAAVAFARIVEQNLVALDPGVVEAARAMGASRFRIIWSVLIPEALAPLILGYTFLFVGVIDMSAMAGAIGGGGLGDFALRFGYQKFNDEVTWAAVLVIVAIVQVAQYFGNWLAKRALHR